MYPWLSFSKKLIIQFQFEQVCIKYLIMHDTFPPEVFIYLFAFIFPKSYKVDIIMLLFNRRTWKYIQRSEPLMDTHWTFRNLNLAPDPLIFRSNSLFKAPKRKSKTFLWNQGWGQRLRNSRRPQRRGNKTVLPFSISFPEK